MAIYHESSIIIQPGLDIARGKISSWQTAERFLRLGGGLCCLHRFGVCKGLQDLYCLHTLHTFHVLHDLFGLLACFGSKFLHLELL